MRHLLLVRWHQRTGYFVDAAMCELKESNRWRDAAGEKRRTQVPMPKAGWWPHWRRCPCCTEKLLIFKGKWYRVEVLQVKLDWRTIGS